MNAFQETCEIVPSQKHAAALASSDIQAMVDAGSNHELRLR